MQDFAAAQKSFGSTKAAGLGGDRDEMFSACDAERDAGLHLRAQIVAPPDADLDALLKKLSEKPAVPSDSDAPKQ